MRGVDICGENAADSPYSVLLAMLMASSSDPVFSTDSTGPNTSVPAICMSGVTPEITVGARRIPAGSAGVRRLRPSPFRRRRLDQPFGPVALRVGHHRAHIRTEFAALDPRAD